MKRSIVFLLLVVISTSVWAELFPGWDKAFIFSVPSILLDISEYNGGLGLKAGKDHWAVRAMADITAKDDGTEPSVFAWGTEGAFQWYLHPLSGDRRFKAFPYTGAAFGISGSSETIEIDGGDWTRDDLLALEFGPFLGVEFFLLENVSLFAEYQLKGMAGWPSVTTHVDGEDNTVSDDLAWSVDMSLGAGGKLGLCVFF